MFLTVADLHTVDKLTLYDSVRSTTSCMHRLSYATNMQQLNHILIGTKIFFLKT